MDVGSEPPWMDSRRPSMEAPHSLSPVYLGLKDYHSLFMQERPTKEISLVIQQTATIDCENLSGDVS